MKTIGVYICTIEEVREKFLLKSPIENSVKSTVSSVTGSGIFFGKLPNFYPKDL